MKTLVIIVTLLLTQINATAQSNSKDSTANKIAFTQSVGAAIGMTTGYGLAYKLTMNNFGIQVAFAPLKNDYETRYNVGLTFLYSLKKTKHTDLFLYQGNRYQYSKSLYEDCEDYDQVDCTPREVTTIENQINNGFGIGISVIFLKNLSFSLMGGYASYDSFSEINFTGEASLFYNF